MSQSRHEALYRCGKPWTYLEALLNRSFYAAEVADSKSGHFAGQASQRTGSHPSIPVTALPHMFSNPEGTEVKSFRSHDHLKLERNRFAAYRPSSKTQLPRAPKAVGPFSQSRRWRLSALGARPNITSFFLIPSCKTNQLFQ